MKINKPDLRIGKYIILVIVFVIFIDILLLNQIKDDTDRHSASIYNFQASNVENLYKSYISNMAFYIETHDAILDETLRSNTEGIVNLFDNIEELTVAGDLDADHDDQDLWSLLDKRTVNEIGYIIFDGTTKEVLYENDYENRGADGMSSSEILDHFIPDETLTVKLESGDVLVIYGTVYEPWQRGVLSFSILEDITLEQSAEKFVNMFKMDINEHIVKHQESIYIIEESGKIVFSNRSEEIGSALELIDIKTGKDVLASVESNVETQILFEYNDVINATIDDYYLFAYPMEDTDQMVIIVDRYNMGNYHNKVIRMTIFISIMTVLISSICIWLIYQNMYVYFEPMDINK